ncbi:MAG: tetratricopeptide repeat protein, partial [Acidobacteriota bacterium]|nr:tetratricopeptide repeat protein [Acidobacteriota bacterium]
MRIAVCLLAAALGLLQATAPPDAIRERERAYRANNVGVARLEQFDYDAAARSFREALQIAPALHIARLNLAIALLYGGRPAEAAPEARAAAKQLPDNPTAHYVVGLIAKADNAMEEGAAAFERVLQLDPRDGGAKIQLGQIQLQQRRYDDALRLFQ